MPSVLNELGEERSLTSTATLYVSIGVRHILPDGLDHILFVLAIFLASVRFRALGVITPSPTIVEPLIALTIGFVAVENLFFKDMTKWRPAVVFGFGLVHGMGFAGFFGDLGLPRGQFWSALISFNVGVEVGQLAVIAVAAILSLGLRRVLNDPRRTVYSVTSNPRPSSKGSMLGS